MFRKSDFCLAFLLGCLSLCVCYCSATSSECVSVYQAGKDYFDAKFDSSFSESFDVTYHNHYKVLTMKGSSFTQTIVMYLCGTPNPNISTSNLTIQIPVSRVAFTATPMITFIELLGERKSIVATGTDPTYISSECVVKLIDEGYIADAYNATTFSVIPSVLENVGVEVTFTNYLEGLPKQAAELDFLEKTVLAQAQYLSYYSLFYNKESVAQEIFSNISTRYNCTAKLASLISARSTLSTVLWCYWTAEFGGPSQWSCASCPNYYCQYMNSLDAKLLLYTDYNLPTNGPYNYLNDSDFIKMAVNAEVWIYTGANFTYTYSKKKALLDEIPAVQDKKVYSLDLDGIDIWFEDKLAVPETVLQDLLSVLAPAKYVTHSRVFLRNSFTESVKTATTCANTSAKFELPSTICDILDAEKLLTETVSSATGVRSTLGLCLIWLVSVALFAL